MPWFVAEYPAHARIFNTTGDFLEEWSADSVCAGLQENQDFFQEHKKGHACLPLGGGGEGVEWKEAPETPGQTMSGTVRETNKPLPWAWRGHTAPGRRSRQHWLCFHVNSV